MNIDNYEFIKGMTNNTLNILKVRGRQYDEIAEKIFRTDCPYFCAEMTEVNVNGNVYFKYNLENYIPIANMNLNMTKNEFIHLLKNMLLPFNECYDWMLQSNYFVMKKEFVFINNLDHNLKYIYSFDTENISTDTEVSDFFSEIISGVMISDSVEFNNILLRMIVDRSVTVGALNDMVKRSANDVRLREQKHISRAQPAPLNLSKPTEIPMTSSPAEKRGAAARHTEAITASDTPVFAPLPEKQEAKPKEIYNPADKLASEKSDTMERLFGTRKEKTVKKKHADKEKKQEKKSSLFSGFLKGGKSLNEQGDLDCENTVFAGDDENTVFSLSEAYLLLKEKKGMASVPERIDIVLNGNNEMVIGRHSEKSSDSGFKFDASLKKISRNHARIFKDNSEYYIVDLNSANKTFVNGSVIQPNTPVSIPDKTLIMFGDTDYIYEFHFV